MTSSSALSVEPHAEFQVVGGAELEQVLVIVRESRSGGPRTRQSQPDQCRPLWRLPWASGFLEKGAAKAQDAIWTPR